MTISFEGQLQNLRSEARQSARKAVDFLDGNQKAWLESLLSEAGTGIKNWQSRGVFPIWENITQMIIEKSAQTYQVAPDRQVLTEGGEVDEKATDKPAMLSDIVKTVEIKMISEALERNDWNRKSAAAELGISYPTLLKKIRKFGLSVE